MDIGVLSDVHLRTAEHDAVLEALASVVERFNETFRPDAVVVLGDLIEHESADVDRAHVTEVRDVLSRLDAPVYYTAGNHDVVYLSAVEVADVLDQRLTRHVADHACDLVLLDTTSARLDGIQGELDDGQLRFLRRALDRAEDAVVCVHHPLHYHSLVGNEWFETQPERAFLTNKREAEEVLAESPSVRAVLNGHIHETDATVAAGVPHFTMNAFNKELPSSEEPTAAHGVLTVDPDGSAELRRFDAEALRKMGGPGSG